MIIEIDYYLNTGNNIYLLRLINSSNNRIIVASGELDYIIVEKVFSNNIEHELKQIISKIKAISLPDVTEQYIAIDWN
jgi:hypothetical protein